MVEDSRQAGVQNSDCDGDRIFALGDRGVLVPHGMTAEMILAGAKVLEEEEHWPSSGYIGHYSARDLARRVWEAMDSAAKEPSRAVPLPHLSAAPPGT
jgi:hypothetical protein